MACIIRSISSLSQYSALSDHSQYSSFSWSKLTTASRQHAAVSRFFMCTSSSSSSPPLAMPLIKPNDSLFKYLPQAPVLLPPEMDEDSKVMELRERIKRDLRRTSSDAVEKMKLIDKLERLGIAYHFEDDIQKLLKGFINEDPANEDLFATGLRFHLLRRNGFAMSTDVFKKFLNNSGKFKEYLTKDTMGMLSLYEASYLGANGEDILLEAKEFTESKLKESLPSMAPQLRRQVLLSLELPRHLRMERFEARKYIEEYSMESDYSSVLLELSKLYYNKVQSLHQMELTEISRWWTQLGLVDKLTFARDRPLECFLWTVGILPEPKYSGCRIELAKTIAILLVIDDIFDTYGSPCDLIIFTEAIRRWDLNAMEELPEYMKLCYMALYNTTNEICYKILKEHGWNALPFLNSTWIEMVDGFMVEAQWVNRGHVPNMEEYIENGVRTAGAFMALVHLFFLIGKGVTSENVKLLASPYPKVFSHSGRILRLWDDLGTAKEEQERGDISSSIQLFMREKNIASDGEARKHVMQLIRSHWRELNGELIAGNSMPFPIIKAALNMARTSQVIYQHDEDSYFSSVDNYVKSLFFTPFDS